MFCKFRYSYKLPTLQILFFSKSQLKRRSKTIETLAGIRYTILLRKNIPSYASVYATSFYFNVRNMNNHLSASESVYSVGNVTGSDTHFIISILYRMHFRMLVLIICPVIVAFGNRFTEFISFFSPSFEI